MYIRHYNACMQSDMDDFNESTPVTSSSRPRARVADTITYHRGGSIVVWSLSCKMASDTPTDCTLSYVIERRRRRISSWYSCNQLVCCMVALLPVLVLNQRLVSWSIVDAVWL